MVEDRSGEVPYDLHCLGVMGDESFGQVGQLIGPELFARGVAGFEDAIGVEQDRIPRFE